MKKLYNIFVYKPNRWYDDLVGVNDTKRFLIFFIPFCIGQFTFGFIGGGWYVGWMCLLSFGFLPWRVSYFYVEGNK